MSEVLQGVLRGRGGTIHPRKRQKVRARRRPTGQHQGQPGWGLPIITMSAPLCQAIVFCPWPAGKAVDSPLLYSRTASSEIWWERLPSRDWDSANQKNRAGTTLPRDEERYKPEKTGCHILVAGMARLLRPCRHYFAKITAKVTIYTDLEYKPMDQSCALYGKVNAVVAFAQKPSPGLMVSSRLNPLSLAYFWPPSVSPGRRTAHLPFSHFQRLDTLAVLTPTKVVASVAFPLFKLNKFQPLVRDSVVSVTEAPGRETATIL